MKIKRTFIYKNNILLGSQKRILLLISILFVVYIPFAKSQDNRSDHIALIKYCTKLKTRLVHVENINNARWVLSNNERYVGHFNMNGRIEFSSIGLSSDTLFVAKRDTIICLNGKTGRKYWVNKHEYRLNKKILNTKSNLIVTDHERLKGINKKTGKLAWVNTEYEDHTNQYDKQKTLLFITKDSTVIALDPSSGETSSILKTPIPIGRLIIYKNLFVSDTRDSLFCVDAKSNKLEWKCYKQSYEPSLVLSCVQNLYLKSDKEIEIIDVKTGKTVLKKNIEESRSDFTPLKSGILTRNYNQNKIMYESFKKNKNNWIYKLPYNEELQIAPYIFPVITVHENILYINSKQNILRAINLKSGELLWEFDTYSRVTSNIVFGDGVLYLVNVTGQVIAIDTNLKDGVQKWTNLRDFE